MFFNPLTPKISPVILLTVCQTIIVMFVWRIWYWCPSGFGPPSADLDPPTKLSENIILNLLVKMDDTFRSSAH